MAKRSDHTPETWLELLGSMTDHRSLATGPRDALFDRLRGDPDRLGAEFEVTMVTSAIVAARNETA